MQTESDDDPVANSGVFRTHRAAGDRSRLWLVYRSNYPNLVILELEHQKNSFLELSDRHCFVRTRRFSAVEADVGHTSSYGRMRTVYIHQIRSMSESR